MIHIVLVEPKNEGNLGAVARVMKNFGFKSLIIVNPQCSIGEEARRRAVHANDILASARTIKHFPKLDYLIATSSKTGRDYNIPRNPITPDELSRIIPENGEVGLIFGREENGLTNEELGKCDFMVKIPTSNEYPSMNLSHSVAVILYELSKSSHSTGITPISLAEKKQLAKMLGGVLNKMNFRSKEKKETQKMVWKKIIGRTFMSKREAYALMGFFRKLI
jgi:TrmH family RNA methyltransferase